MGLWSLYFLIRFALYALDYTDFSPWLNLSFAAFTALTPKNKRQRFAKNLIAAPLGIILLYHDSWLPPIAQAMSQAQNLRSFSSAYLLELAGRFIDWKLIAKLVALFVVYSLARRKLRLSTFVFIGIFAVILVPHGLFTRQFSQASNSSATGAVQATRETESQDMRPEALDAKLAQFYAEQKKVHVKFTKPPAESSAYDIFILHVCSLSWDDLKTLKFAPETFFGRFDVVLSSFSSGASYSGPAAIRLLRGACGQPPENQLYVPVGSECLVMDGLQSAGFEPHWLMNHDGHFGNFFGDVRDRGGMTAPLEDISGAAQGEQAFDGTPIYSDYSVLSRWWAKRQQNSAPRVALYYNTISLHDGNRVVGRNDSSYGARFAQFSADITHFLDDLRKSGRHVVVVFIAEHGAALGGDRRQISGLREIPTSAIAHVPVAIALINATRPQPATQERIDAPSSYPALNELLSRFITDNPFDKPDLSLGKYTSALPQSDFVAENNATTVMQVGSQYMMRSPDGTWSNLE